MKTKYKDELATERLMKVHWNYVIKVVLIRRISILLTTIILGSLVSPEVITLMDIVGKQ